MGKWKKYLSKRKGILRGGRRNKPEPPDNSLVLDNASEVPTRSVIVRTREHLQAYLDSLHSKEEAYSTVPGLGARLIDDANNGYGADAMDVPLEDPNRFSFLHPVEWSVSRYLNNIDHVYVRRTYYMWGGVDNLVTGIVSPRWIKEQVLSDFEGLEFSKLTARFTSTHGVENTVVYTLIEPGKEIKKIKSFNAWIFGPDKFGRNLLFNLQSSDRSPFPAGRLNCVYRFKFVNDIVIA